MSATLVVLAAGRASRYGRLKQLDPVGPSGETLFDYGIHDARAAGFSHVVVVVGADTEATVRRHLDARWPGLHASLAVQRRDSVAPAGVGQTRTRPWGTAHAVLSAEEFLVGPFAVMNADDFYGAGSFRLLTAWFERTAGEVGLVVGFRLAATLSTGGGVSRAVCDTGPDGRLVGLTECLDVRVVAGVIRGSCGRGERSLEPDATASMNLWGFRPAILPMLRAGFAAFLADPRRADDAEFRLPDAVSALIGRGVRIGVVRTTESWMGMTFAEDREPVRSRLRSQAEAGDYPSPLGTAGPGQG